MADAVESNPTLARRVLAVRLNALREQHEHDLQWLADELDVDLSQASRLDTGARGFQPEQVEALCQAYGLSPVQSDALLALAEEARKRAWWQQVKVAASYRTLIGLERAAVEINEFSSSVVPGLLQTKAYADAAVRHSTLSVNDSTARLAVEVRMRRQEILSRPKPPHLGVVIDEAVLARGPARGIMREQLDYLIAASEERNVRIQVLPFSQGFYPTGTGGQSILLRFALEIPDVYYTEDVLRSQDTVDPELVEPARSLWDRLQGLCVSTTDSIALIREYRDRL